MNNALKYNWKLISVALVCMVVVLYGARNLVLKDPVQQAELTESLRETKSLENPREKHAVAKPGAAVSLKNSAPLYAAAPGIYEYSLVLASSINQGKMTVNVSASDGVLLTSEKQHFEFDIQENAEYLIPITVQVDKPGRYYIQCQVFITDAGRTSSRVLAAILQVGEDQVKAQKATVDSVGKESEKIIVLPAQETISPR